MANTNCVDGMACPKYGEEGPFKIAVTTWMLVYGDGIDEHEDAEWDDQSGYLCTQCESAGKVKVLRSRTNTLGGDTDE